MPMYNGAKFASYTDKIGANGISGGHHPVDINAVTMPGVQAF